MEPVHATSDSFCKFASMLMRLGTCTTRFKGAVLRDLPPLIDKGTTPWLPDWVSHAGPKKDQLTSRWLSSTQFCHKQHALQYADVIIGHKLTGAR